jgi:ethanolamine permease
MSTSLKSSLNAWHLWGLAVGLVISGEYFGWSYGWDKAGTLGFLASPNYRPQFPTLVGLSLTHAAPLAPRWRLSPVLQR